jgi:hypothetical protein
MRNAGWIALVLVLLAAPADAQTGSRWQPRADARLAPPARPASSWAAPEPVRPPSVPLPVRGAFFGAMAGGGLASLYLAVVGDGGGMGSREYAFVAGSAALGALLGAALGMD